MEKILGREEVLRLIPKGISPRTSTVCDANLSRPKERPKGAFFPRMKFYGLRCEPFSLGRIPGKGRSSCRNGELGENVEDYG